MFPYVHADTNGQGQNDYDGLAKHPPRPSEQQELLKNKKKIFNFNLKIRICKATVSLRHVKWKRPEVSIYFLSFSDILTLFKIFLTMQEYFFPLFSY